MRPQAAGGPTDLTGREAPFSDTSAGKGPLAGCCENAVAPGRRRPGWRAARERRPVLPVGASPRHCCATRSEIAHRQPRRSAGTAWNVDLRPASRGSAKPAPMTPRHANVSAAPSPRTGCRDHSLLLLSRLRPATAPIGVVCYNYDLYIQTETRYISVGEVDGVAIIVVAHTKRSGRIRLISARPASRKERQAWYEHLR